MNAVVLLSGGMDSCVLATLAAKQFGPKGVLAVSIDYGQRHQRELSSALRISAELHIHHRVLQLPPQLFKGANSTLTDPKLEMPHMTYQELETTPGVSPTYVPFRNAIFISMATALAVIEKAQEVWVGTHAEDARNWAYPDCTPEFNGAMANALFVGTYMGVRLISPFQWMMKTDVARLGLKILAPLELSWSCYEGGTEPCGKCPTCVERARAFEDLGQSDPALDFPQPPVAPFKS